MALAAICLCSSCTKDCTLRYCADRFEIGIYQDVNEPTAAGLYEIVFNWPGGDFREIIIEVSGEGESTAAEIVTGQGLDNWSIVEIRDGKLYLNIAQLLVENLDLDEGMYKSHVQSPDEVTIWVYSNSTVLGQQTVFPNYEWYWCNGKDHEECNDKKNYLTEVTIIVDDL
jgi:hypothetical protein